MFLQSKGGKDNLNKKPYLKWDEVIVIKSLLNDVADLCLILRK